MAETKTTAESLADAPLPSGECQFSESATRTAGSLLSYYKSCVASARSATDSCTADGERVAGWMSALTDQQRRRFARCLWDLAVASMRVARNPGDFLPAPANVELRDDWLARVEKLRNEFLTSGERGAARVRIVERLNRELILAGDARGRALRCLRMARQLAADSEDVALALAFHRARRGAPRGAFEKLQQLAEGACDAHVRARARLGIASLRIRLQQYRAALRELRAAVRENPHDLETWTRIAYCTFVLGRDGAGARALARVAAGLSRGAPGGAASDALGFLKSPESGFPRLFITCDAGVALVRKQYPEFVLSILEAVQRSSRRARVRRAGLPAKYLEHVRARLRVPFAAVVVDDGVSRPFVLARSALRTYAVAGERMERVLAEGGPGGVVRKAREMGDAALVIARRPREFLLDCARSAAAVQIEAPGIPQIYLVVETDLRLGLDPSELAALAEAGTGAVCALWLAHAASPGGA